MSDFGFWISDFGLAHPRRGLTDALAFNLKSKSTIRRGGIQDPESPHRAFTLIEVLIVIAIMLAIGTIVVLNLMPRREQADIDLQGADIVTIGRALDMFKLEMKRYPTEEEGLAALWNKSVIADEDEAAAWRGPYLQDPITNDRWNNPLIYRFPGQLRGEQYYDLISTGPDGQESTGDDIHNHSRFANEDGEIDTMDDSFAPPVTGESTSP